MIRDLVMLSIFAAAIAFGYAVTTPPTVQVEVSAGIEAAAIRIVKERFPQ